VTRAWHERVNHAGAAVLAVVFALVVALYIAGIPGARVQTIVIEHLAPPVPAEVQERDASVEALVVATDRHPLRGARVQALAVLDGHVHLAGTATTDAQGRATIAGLPRAEHWILADADERARGATMVALAGGPREVELVLDFEHRLDVRVVDEAGAPVPNAELEIAGKDPLPIGARTGPDGTVRVRRLGSGPFTVTARANGLDPATERFVAEGASPRLVLKKLATIVAHVVDASGAPAAGARVLIAGASLWPARAADTDAAGTVRVASLATGTYAMRATRRLEASAIELGIAVKGGDSKDVTLQLAPGATVTARVVEGEGNDAPPVRGARVTLAEGGLSPFPVEGVTDAKGVVHLGPIARGSASLSVQADGFVARGGIAVPEPVPSEVRVELARAGTLSGHVVDARGFPVDGATIEVVGTDFQGAPIDEDPRRTQFREAHFLSALGGPRPLVPAGELGVMPGPVPAIPHAASAATPIAQPASGPPVEPWVTRGDGTFRASPVSPGRVRALVRHPQFVEAMSDVVTLTSGGEAKVEVVMHAGGSLEGRVLDPSGHAVAGARVTVVATRGSMERTTRTGSDGSFAFASLPEAVALAVSTSEDVGQVRARLALTIPEGGKREVTITLSDPRAPIAVRVKDDRGYAVPAVQIGVSSLEADSPLRATVYTDARGEAKVEGGKGLVLRLEASAPGFAPRALTTDKTTAAIDVVLSRAESAGGEVRSQRGDPIADAEVVLYTELGAKHARSDARGEYRVAGLAAGAARLRVHAPGFAPFARAIAIDASSGQRPAALPRVEMAAEAIVEGVVVDARGEYVQGARIARDRVPTYLAVGASPSDVAVTDARGRFHLGELAEGTASLEAFAPDVGRGRADSVRVVAGRTTDGVRIVLRAALDEKSIEPAASGGVAVTLGLTHADEVVLVAVADGSAAERAGLAPGDVLVEIDGAKVGAIVAARGKLSGPLGDDVVVKLRRAERSLALRVPREPVRR
jgi:Carboxypeptidase regulatory-like domain/PDZ domain